MASWSWTPSGTIVLVNRELERQFGYAREELVGQSVELLLPERRRAVQARIRDDFVHGAVARPMAPVVSSRPRARTAPSSRSRSG